MNSLFSYSKKNSVIHRCPAWIKLILLLAVPITVHLSPIEVCLSAMALFALLSLVSRTPFVDFLRDLRPAAYYSIFLVLTDIISHFAFRTSDEVVKQSTLFLILKLLCAVEVSSVFFRTTGIHEIRQTLQFGRGRNAVSSLIVMFLGFLPQIFADWSALDLSYTARGGKRGIRKAVVLLPLLISMSIRKAGTTYLALLNRS